MSKEKIEHFIEEIKNYLENIELNKNKIIELYKQDEKNWDDCDRMYLLDKVLNKQNNRDLFNLFINDLNFNAFDVILYTLTKYNNNYFLKLFDFFKQYIDDLDKMQLDGLLILLKKYNIGDDFCEYLIKKGADEKILSKRIGSHLKFYDTNGNFFREKSSKSCRRDRVLLKFLLDEMGHPEKKLHNVIHITGSNGKGSTCHFLKYILEENGYTVNMYTNPKVIHYSENYIIKGREISDEEYDKLLFSIKNAYDNVILREDYKKAVEEANNEDIKHGRNIKDPKYDGVLAWCFSIVAMILAFSENEADFNIIEVRNGGLNDLTNVFSSNETATTVLTYIQYGIGSNDGTMPIYHKNGEVEYSNRATAFHKAMLGKKNVPIVVANQTDDVLEEIRKVAKEIGTETVEYGREWFIEDENENNFIFKGFGKNIKINKSKTLFESFQTKNIATALAVLFKLQELEKINIKNDLIQKAIDKTNINGRLHKILEGNFVDYFNNKNLEIITGFIKFNEGGAGDFINLLNENEFKYIIYTTNALKVMKKDITLFKELKKFNDNEFKLIIYSKNNEIFDYIREQAKINEINYVAKACLPSALIFVKNDMQILKNEKIKLFIVCESMLKFDENIEIMN